MITLNLVSINRCAGVWMKQFWIYFRLKIHVYWFNVFTSRFTLSSFLFAPFVMTSTPQNGRQAKNSLSFWLVLIKNNKPNRTSILANYSNDSPTIIIWNAVMHTITIHYNRSRFASSFSFHSDPFPFKLDTKHAHTHTPFEMEKEEKNVANALIPHNTSNIVHKQHNNDRQILTITDFKCRSQVGIEKKGNEMWKHQLREWTKKPFTVCGGQF